MATEEGSSKSGKTQMPAEVQLGAQILRLRWVIIAIGIFAFIMAIYMLYKPAGSYQGYEAGSFRHYYTYYDTYSSYDGYAADINGHLFLMRMGMLLKSIIWLLIAAGDISLLAFSIRWSSMFDEDFIKTHPDDSPQMEYLTGNVLPKEMERLHPGEAGTTVRMNKASVTLPIFCESLNFPAEYLLRPGMENGIAGTGIDKAYVDGVRAWVQGSWHAKASLFLNGLRLDSNGYLVPLISLIDVPDYQAYPAAQTRQAQAQAQGRHFTNDDSAAGAAATEAYEEAQRSTDASSNPQAASSDAVAPAQRSAKFCPQCGSPLRPGTKFCPNCGAKL